jgi:hypothetical protein
MLCQISGSHDFTGLCGRQISRVSAYPDTTWRSTDDVSPDSSIQLCNVFIRDHMNRTRQTHPDLIASLPYFLTTRKNSLQPSSLFFPSSCVLLTADIEFSHAILLTPSPTLLRQHPQQHHPRTHTRSDPPTITATAIIPGKIILSAYSKTMRVNSASSIHTIYHMVDHAIANGPKNPRTTNSY